MEWQHKNEASVHRTAKEFAIDRKRVSGGSRILKGGFKFRQITVLAHIVTSWYARRRYMSMQRLRSRCPPARSAENFQNLAILGPLRSHLLAFQAPYSRHRSGSRRPCRICSTAPVGLIASFCSSCSWFVKLTTSQ